MDQSSRPSEPQPTVLVTGGAGFVGAEVTRTLLASGARVIVVDDLSGGDPGRLEEHRCLEFHVADVTVPGILDSILNGGPSPDAIVHLAARVGVARVLTDPEGCREEHLAAARELVRYLESLRFDQRPRVIAASTSEVYQERGGPLREQDALRPVDGSGRWAYAGSKLAVERLLDEAWAEDPSRGPVHVRLFNVVGPGQDGDSGMVLPRFIAAAAGARPIPVHGDGQQVRTFGHVEDVAADLARVALDGSFPPGPLNLGGDARATVHELALEVLAVTGSDAGIRRVDPVDRLGTSFEEVRRREPCLDRARSLGLVLRTRSLREIVEDAVAARPRISSAVT